MARRIKPTVMETLPPLTRRQHEILLTVIGRKESAFQAVSEQLKPEHFGLVSYDLGVLWASICDHYTSYGTLPPEEWLVAEYERRLEDSGEDLTDDELSDTDDFIRRMYAFREKTLNDEVAKDYAKSLIQENLLKELETQLHNARGVPSDLGTLLADYHTKVENTSSLTGGHVPRITDGGWNTVPVVRTPTNVPLFDTFLRGGDAPGEVYGFMAPYGTCKTLLMVQLSFERAKLSYNRWLASDKKDSLGLVYFFQYEEQMKPDILIRVASYAGQISKERLEDSCDWEQTLSRSHNLQVYERDLFAQQLSKGAKVLGEWERLQLAQPILDSTWIGVGMNEADSGSGGGGASRGTGYVSEIAAIITNDMAYRERELGCRCHVAGVYLDYLGAMVERHAEATGKSEEFELRRLLSKFTMHGKRRIAYKFKTPLWVCQQFGAEGNKKKAGIILDHTSAAECKTVAENWNFALNIGCKDGNDCVVVSQSKGRRTGSMREKIMKINGLLSKVEDVSAQYRLDNGRIVDVKEYEMAGNSAEQQAGPNPSALRPDREEEVDIDVG